MLAVDPILPVMPRQVVIDGNNLLYAMREHAPIPNVGRETMVRIIERWAKTHEEEVTLVFDGPKPDKGMAQQLSGAGLDVRFSAPRTADDVIVDLIHSTKDASALRVVSADTAIVYEASARRCRHTAPIAFIAELFPPERAASHPAAKADPPQVDKPDQVTSDEAKEMLDLFDEDDGPAFDGFDAMRF